LEIESLAIVRALIKEGLSKKPVLIIDLGASRTSFIVFSGYSLRFTFSISVSAKKFTEAIVKSLDVKEDKAEKLKIKHGLSNKEDSEGKEVFEALIAPLTDLTEQIKNIWIIFRGTYPTSIFLRQRKR